MSRNEPHYLRLSNPTTTPLRSRRQVTRVRDPNSVVFVFLCRSQVEEPVPSVQPAAAQALRPVSAEVPVHRGLPARPMLSGKRQGRLPAAQGIDTAARRPAVHPPGCRRPIRSVVSAAAAATTAAASISPPTQLKRARGPYVEDGIALSPAPTHVPTRGQQHIYRRHLVMNFDT